MENIDLKGSTMVENIKCKR